MILMKHEIESLLTPKGEEGEGNCNCIAKNDATFTIPHATECAIFYLEDISTVHQGIVECLKEFGKFCFICGEILYSETVSEPLVLRYVAKTGHNEPESICLHPACGEKLVQIINRDLECASGGLSVLIGLFA